MKIRVLALSALLAISSSALAEDIKERTIRFGHLVQPGHPLALGVQKFADLVSEKSGGKIKVREFGGSVLGSESQQMSAVQGGVQQMFVPATTTASALVKEFSLIDTPFAFQNTSQVDALLGGPFGTSLQERLPERGIVGMGFWETGFRNFTNNRQPIIKMEDMRGLKTRVMGDPLFLDSFKALGTNPVPMAFGELYGALESGALDAEENPYSIVLTSKFYEVQKYMSETNHVYTANLVMMSKRFWDQLSDTEKQILSEAAAEAGEYQRTISREKAKVARDQLIANGMEINSVPQDSLDQMRAATDPVADGFANSYDPALVDLYRSEMKRIRAAYP
ncbi:TRAP transporter substrate-binding protein [Orrella marina]|uniref:ABC transporter substrate-binding protein n=1 Tax=Orrella marina TaxID=2163011 RepID=A0A2R4XP95_9BURK|nr:TRAP transporter substrate-binding protein [Orrella marina]AWB35634.1 ABC transporter substrate-binding protein [Orrella marina]